MKSSCNNFYSLLFLACTFTLVPQPSYSMNANAAEQIPLISGHSLLENMHFMAVSKINAINQWLSDHELMVRAIMALTVVAILGYDWLKNLTLSYNQWQRYKEEQFNYLQAEQNDQRNKYRDTHEMVRDLWHSQVGKEKLLNRLLPDQ